VARLGLNWERFGDLRPVRIRPLFRADLGRAIQPGVIWEIILRDSLVDILRGLLRRYFTHCTAGGPDDLLLWKTREVVPFPLEHLFNVEAKDLLSALLGIPFLSSYGLGESRLVPN
jgi:hypothetical protein